MLSRNTRLWLFLLIGLFSTLTVFGQTTPAYNKLVHQADSLYASGDYKNSALTYSAAFKANDWKATSNDRYNAACSWALSGQPDSAFFNLNRVATLMDYRNYAHITADTDLNSLHKDKRWEPLIAVIKANKEKAEAHLNKPLVAQLDSIYTEDQQYRMQIDAIEKKYGWESPEMKAHWELINMKDSVNLIKVMAILDKYGWLGPEVVGQQGNITLFLVIQHSDIAVQEKYLPMMREAVKNGKAQGSNLALLEDRVALRQGKRQLYGSQIAKDAGSEAYYISPLEDPDNVDKRRAEVGLPPLADYVMRWNIKWDVEQYKKDLPGIEEREKAKKK